MFGSRNILTKFLFNYVSEHPKPICDSLIVATMNTKLNLHHDGSVLLIRRFEEGRILIQDTEYTKSLIVTPTQVFSWDINQLDSLNHDSFSLLFEMTSNPELVLLGTGKQLVFPKPAQTRALIEAQIGLEVMDTAAACRTYNILADDGRKVAACLLL